MPIAEILIDQPRVLELLIEVVCVDLRINVPVDLKNVRPAIIVVVDKPAAPRHIAAVHTNAGSKGDIAEGSIAIVVIKVAGVVREVGFEDVEPAVAVVVRYRNAHARLLVAAIAVSAIRHHRDIGKRAVVVVLKQNAWLGIHGNIDIRPAIVIEVIGDRSDGVARPGLQNAGLLRDVGEGPIAIVVIQNIRVARKSARTAQDGNALPLAVMRGIGRRNLVRIELEVIAHEEIEKAVSVVVKKRAAGAPANVLLIEPGFLRDICKCAVPIVMEEDVVSPETAEQIVPTIIVVVADADAGLPTRPSQS